MTIVESMAVFKLTLFPRRRENYEAKKTTPPNLDVSSRVAQQCVLWAQKDPLDRKSFSDHILANTDSLTWLLLPAFLLEVKRRAELRDRIDLPPLKNIPTAQPDRVVLPSIRVALAGDFPGEDGRHIIIEIWVGESRESDVPAADYRYFISDQVFWKRLNLKLTTLLMLGNVSCGSKTPRFGTRE